MAVLVRRYTRDTEEFHRKLILPVEDKRTAWVGGYRYFRAPNIIPIEHYRLSGRVPAPIGLGKMLPFPRAGKV